MPPIPVALPKSTFPGKLPQEARGILTNCYVEPTGEDGDAKWLRVPGVTQFGSAVQTGLRGRIVVGNFYYAVVGTKFIRWSQAGGTGSIIGEIPGEAPVIMAHNSASTPDIVIVSPGDGAYWSDGSTVGPYPDDTVGQPNSVCILKSVFVFSYGDGSVRNSDPNSTNINDLSNAAAESRPDTLYRAIPLGDGTLGLFGSSSIEQWGGENDTGFIFSYMAMVPRGLIGSYAIAGYEDGFSAGIFYVADDCGVYQWGGQKISPPDLDRLIGEVLDKNDIEVFAFVSRGHSFVGVQSASWTWIFDCNTSKWHVRKSYLASRWRATQPCKFFDRWIVGDLNTGTVGYVDAGSKTEYGDPLIYQITSGPQKDFPNRMRVNRVFLYLTVGAGVATGANPTETDPIVEIECSGDGGVTWTIPRLRAIGQQAKGRTSVSANNFGHATGQGIRWRFTISDPIDVSIMGAAMEVRELRP